jgi:hypothetical protein
MQEWFDVRRIPHISNGKTGVSVLTVSPVLVNASTSITAMRETMLTVSASLVAYRERLLNISAFEERCKKNLLLTRGTAHMGCQQFEGVDRICRLISSHIAIPHTFCHRTVGNSGHGASRGPHMLHLWHWSRAARLSNSRGDALPVRGPMRQHGESEAQNQINMGFTTVARNMPIILVALKQREFSIQVSQSQIAGAKAYFQPCYEIGQPVGQKYQAKAETKDTGLSSQAPGYAVNSQTAPVRAGNHF